MMKVHIVDLTVPAFPVAFAISTSRLSRELYAVLPVMSTLFGAEHALKTHSKGLL